MHTHSDIFYSRLRKSLLKVLGAALLCIGFSGIVSAQVTVVTTVNAPYNIPLDQLKNQVILTISTGRSFVENGYLTMLIRGDNGVTIQSNLSVFGSPVNIGTGQMVMFQGSNGDLDYIFQPDALGYSGTSSDEVFNTGLPPGTYQMCFRVWSSDGQPLSQAPPQGCGVFTIQGLNNATVTTQVMPPFGTELLNYSNNTKIYLQAPGYNGNTSLYLHITGDNGVDLATRQDYLPNDINLKSANPVSPIDLFPYFEASNLVSSGLPVQQLLTNGLPEGSYRICVRLRDIQGNFVSLDEPAGCSNIFDIRYTDPPLTVNPVCGDSLNLPAQNIIFSWAPAPGAPPFTQYRLKIVEMLDPDQNPNEAMLTATEPAFFETSVEGGLSFYYGPNQPILEPGTKYAWQVIAEDPETHTKFRNEGKSEVCWFVWAPSSLSPALNVNNTGLNFEVLAPAENTDTVSGQQDFYSAWGWRNNGEYFKTDSLQAYQDKKISAYRMTILPATQKTGRLTDPAFSFQVHIPSGDTVSHYAVSHFQCSVDSVVAIGMKDDYWYKVEVKAIDSSKTVVATAVSKDFRLRIQNPYQGPVAHIRGQLKYKFDNYPDYYPIANTPVRFFPADEENDAISSANKSVSPLSPVISGRDFYAKTDADGRFTLDIPMQTAQDSMYYRIDIESHYYKPIDSVYTVRDTGDTIRLGTIETTAYNYSLKLYVVKAFGSFKIVKDNSYYDYNNNYVTEIDTIYKQVPDSVIQDMPAGIDFILYRKKKPYYIPPVEGQFDKPVNENGIIKIAEGKTVVEIGKNGKKASYVKFDRLLCNVFNDDIYYYKAINPDSSGINGEAEPYEDGSFQASEQEFRFMKPPSSGNITHFDVTDTCKLITRDPPKSTVSGQLVYSWPGDPDTPRPLANEKFSVVVEYLFEGKPVQFVKIVPNGNYITKLHLDNGKGYLQTGDNGLEVGSGTTDSNGRFSIQVVNLNKKGQLGSGTASTTGGPNPFPTPAQNGIPNPMDAIVSPMDQSFITDLSDLNGGTEGGGFFSFGDLGASFGNSAQSSLLNGMMNGGAGAPGQQQFQGYHNTIKNINNEYFGSGTDEIPGGMAGIHGPYMPQEILTNADPQVSGQIQRVYRIRVADQDFYYNPETNIVVQPLDATDAGPIKVMVKEEKWNFSVKEKKTGNTMDGMIAVIFRDPSSKVKHLPQGEGDGQYRVNKLINPQYSGEVNIPAQQQSGQVNNSGTGVSQENNWQKNIQNYSVNGNSAVILSGGQSWEEGTYEWIADSETDNKGNVSFNRLDGGFRDYYLEVASDPSQGEKFYKAELVPLNSSATNIFYGKNSDGFYINSSDNATYGNYWDTRQVDIPEANVTVEMTPFPSRVGGRVMDKNSSLGIKHALVILTDSIPNFIGIRLTDSSGYFEFLNVFDLAKVPKGVENLNVIMSAYAKGYRQQGFKKGVVSRSGGQYIDDILMTSAATMTGYVKNKNGIPVDAYIKRPDGLTVETKGFKIGQMFLKNQIGRFSLPIPVQAGGNAVFYIIPKDPGYFTDTVTVKNIKEGINDIGTHTVYRRMHHMHFYVTDLNHSDQMIAGARIILNKQLSVKTNSNGEARLDFENVSINHYTITVSGPEGSGYISQVINLKNEESKYAKNYSIKLKKGGSVSGTVTLDGSPVAGARIYLDYKEQTNTQSGGFYVVSFSYTNTGGNQNNSVPSDAQQLNNGTLPEIEARSDAQGHYRLQGIPINSGQVTVYAALDTSFTVIGDHKTVDLTNNSAIQDLALKSYKDMLVQSIYGFPLTVESLTATNNQNVVNVTGVVKLDKSSSPFNWISGEKEIRVRDVPFAKKVVNGKSIGRPVNDLTGLDAVSSLKMQYLSKYNILITAAPGKSSGQSSVNELQISRGDQDKGELTAYAHIVDNSFNYPSSYLNFQNKDQFYLGRVTGNAVNNHITAFRALGTDEQPVLNPSEDQLSISGSFHLSNGQGKSIQFNFIQFNATADPLNSYIADDGKIHLDVSMDAQIPHAQPDHLTVHAGDIVLDNGAVYPAKGAKPLEVKLEEWSLEISNWSIDPKQGGIYSEKGLIKTGKLDIPFTKFNLRSDMFVMSGFQLNKLMLGNGVKQLSDISTGNANLVYDTKSGSDMSGHWKLAIAGSGNSPAARITGLNPYLNKDIEIEYIQLLSNGEDIFTIKQTNDPFLIRSNGLAVFRPQTIKSGTNFFSVTGGLAIPAPRLIPVMTTLKFTGNPSSLNMVINPVQMSFEGKGYVNFTADKSFNPIINPDKITLQGQVGEKDGFYPINAKFYAEGNKTSNAFFHVDLEKGYVLNLTGGGSSSGSKPDYNLKISSGGMKVPQGAGDWDLLTFSGNLLTEDKTLSTGDEDNNKMTFTVHGAVDVNGDSMSVSNIDLPFGTMNMVYEFPERTLRGTLDVNQQKLGPFTVGGNIEMKMSPAGWYFLGACQVNTGLPGPFSSMNMGFLLGNEVFGSEEGKIVVDKVTQYSFSKSSLCWLKEGKNNVIHGLFITAGKTVINKNLSTNLGVASIYFSALAGGEASLYTDFDPWGVYLSAGLYGKVEAAAAALNVSVNGSVSLDGSLTGAVTSEEACVGGKIEAQIDGAGHVYLQVKTLDFSFSKSAVVGLTLSNKSGVNTKFYFGSTARKPGCDQQCPCGN